MRAVERQSLGAVGIGVSGPLYAPERQHWKTVDIFRRVTGMSINARMKVSASAVSDYSDKFNSIQHSLSKTPLAEGRHDPLRHPLFGETD